MKKAMMLMMVCAMVLALGVGNAAAWVNATVSEAGGSIFGVSFVRLSSAPGAALTFTNVQFWIWDTFPDAKNMLATALTAYANSKNVSVEVGAGPFATGSPLYGIIALP
jgi:hypothetical protein